MADPIDKNGQDVSASDFQWYGASSAGNDTYALTGVGGVATAYKPGRVIVFKADVANTGACSLNINTIGAKNIKCFAPAGIRDLVDGEIAAGQLVAVTYDTANDCWIMISERAQVHPAQGSVGVSVSSSGTNFTADDSNVLTLTLPKACRVLLAFAGSSQPVANGQIQTFGFSFNIDSGTIVGGVTDIGFQPVSPVPPLPYAAIAVSGILTAGSHTFKIRITGVSSSSMSRALSGTLYVVALL